MINRSKNPAKHQSIMSVLEVKHSTTFRRTILNMPESHEEINEGISPEEIDAVLADPDPWEAARRLLKSKSGVVQRNVDIDLQLEPLKGLRNHPRLLARKLAEILWSWKLSFDGLTTGIQTSKGRKGVGYAR